LELRRRGGRTKDAWPDRYVNARTGKEYEPHNDDEAVFVYDDEPRFALLRGGWGAGKSVAGVVKALSRCQRRMNGIMVSPELEHFKVSLWPAFRDWCPWSQVVESQRRRQAEEWQPFRAFSMVFTNGAVLYCGGIKDATRWFGGNVHFAHFDEAARYPDASALKTLVGRARLVGPGGEPPQVFITTTPAKNWLWEYFGPAQEDDPLRDFKATSFVGTVRTLENLDNLDPEYVEAQRETLTAAEARQYLEAEWEDTSDVDKFVNIVWWDNCKEELPPLSRDEPLVLALDAAKGGETATPDSFAVVGVTRHPSRKADVAVRYCGIWMPPAGGLLDYGPIKDEVRRLCREFSVIEVAYDPYQLHDFGMTMKGEGLANFREFKQTTERLIGDKQLQDLIMSKRIAHDGNPLLRKHVDNANAKKSGDDRNKLRIVKRAESLKTDGTVALSMAAARCLYYNIG
jgi:hypothetical protein